LKIISSVKPGTMKANVIDNVFLKNSAMDGIGGDIYLEDI
jgi:hypothetical protein